MRTARAALALLLAFAVPVRAETTTDPLWYLLSTYVLAPDARAVEAEGDGPADAKGLAALQADLLLLSDGFEGFRDEAQVKETLGRLEPRMSPELKPFFKDRASSLDAIYRTLAVTDYTWAQRFPEPPCSPGEARRKLLDSRDGLFQTEKGQASPWLVSLLGPQVKGKSAEQALDQASSQAKLTGAEYEKLRARVRKLTLALASDKAAGAARSKLYCSRAAAFADLAASQRVKDAALISAAHAVGQKPEESVFVVVWKDQRAAATLLRTKSGAMLVTDAAVVADTDHPKLFAFSENAKPIELTATVVRRHPELSVAVLAYSEDLSRPALALSDTVPAKDDLVTAVGHTMVSGLWTKTSGLVTKIGDVSFQTDAAISPELSGGPVLNESGEVTGILVLRRADTEEGRWPVAIPAPVLVRWLNEPEPSFSAGPATESIEDAGTAAILTRARPSALTEASLPPMIIPGLPPPPSEPRGVCMNCSRSNSPSRSFSGGSSYDSGSAELGQALGQLGAVLILQGIPALFRGLGKLFKGNGTAAPKTPPKSLTKTAPASTAKPEPPPPPPPKPECKLIKGDAPAKAGADPFAVSVRLSCNDQKIPLSKHFVTFTFEWDGKKSTQTVTVPTDASGDASLVMQVSNDETKVEKVRDTSKRNHDELDHYDPDKKDPEEPPEPREAEPAPAPLFVSHDAAPITASDTVTIARTAAATAAVEAEEAIAASMSAARAVRIASAVRAGRVFTLAGSGTALRVTATITLSGAATTVAGAVIVLVTVKQTFDIGWAIGTVAEGKISEVQWGLKQYDREDAIEDRAKKALKEEDDCSMKSGENVLDRFVDGSRLNRSGYLDYHEGRARGLGHTLEEHVVQESHLRKRLSRRYPDVSTFDGQPTAEQVIRDAVMANLSGVTDWGSRRANTEFEAPYRGQAGMNRGFGFTLDSPSIRDLRHNAQVVLRQRADCSIFILTAYPTRNER